ncbi:Taurine catabolism dioxygenase TauD/TfdA [Streptomyces albus]|uniref:Taurine catabolism dioxygenase TauD/TfdA n=1 Tax=Streptomyces albus (strain ATCC 21838 / DSM 41398 / FERM P-419 / JCM 4703 / NBRC 107858) TaxID=1081613 RepID=A0A0B5F587_STRA4|nr:Taurine catabolism dioxygenase TauD/TfdA [Streptomyces albus]AOU81039.1 Taurine catabolism dioxygenase TauD/TfdA [Streptomyces albus]AYN36742.1 gamma-butyrobetaine dioxygenase [Streptomyces albus]
MTLTSDQARIPGLSAMEPFGVRSRADGGQRLTELPVPALRELVRTHRLVLLRGYEVPAEAEELAAWCRQWGEVMSWPFGDVLELREAQDPTDHIFDCSSVPFHWDGMYKPFVPEFQVFHCLRAPGPEDGGATTFCDTVRLLDETDPELLDRWRQVTVTYRIGQVVHYGGKAVSPLLVEHPVSGAPTLRFNAPPPEEEPDFLNRPAHEFAGVGAEDVPELLAGLRAALTDPRWSLAHAWQDGDVVLADNHALLHGRERFRSRAPRHLRRVHLLGDPAHANLALG